MAENKQELKIRTKLCGVKSNVAKVEWEAVSIQRTGKFMVKMRRHELDFQQEVRFGWMPKAKGTGEKNGRTFVSNVNYSDFSKCLISRVRVA